MYVFIADITFLNNSEIYNNFTQYVSLERIKKAEQYKQQADKARSLGAILLASAAIHKYYPFVPQPLTITQDFNGKPTLKEDAGVYFSMSHAGNFASCALSYSTNIGVDIEKPRLWKHSTQGTCNRFFTSEEQNIVNNELVPENKCKQFVKLWTRKESYVKATGEGLSASIQTIDTSSNEVYRDGEKTSFFVKSYFLPKEYTISVCSIETDFPETIEEMNLQTLFPLN